MKSILISSKEFFIAIWNFGLIRKALMCTIVVLLLSCASKVYDLEILFKLTNEAQRNRVKSIFQERETNESQILVQFKKLLNHPNLCSQVPKTRYEYIKVNTLKYERIGKTLAYAFINNIVVSMADDKKVFTYSWDRLDGGTSHNYMNYLVYVDQENKCHNKAFNAMENTDEVGYYNIESVESGNKHLYLLFGYGTYGGGQQHYVIRILEIEGKSIAECIECYPDQKIVKIVSNRSQNIELNYDSRKKAISYRQFQYNEDTGFFASKYSIVNLRFIDGKLTP